MIILLYNVVLNVLNKKQKNEVNAKAEFTTLAKRTTSFTSIAKLLQKSEMRKDIVIELSYKGFG